MSEQDDLDQKRDAIIKQIKQVFPKNPPGKGKLRITKSSAHESSDLKEMLEGKRWEDVIGHRSIIYRFSDADYLFAISDEAYQYFLPAYLVATMYLQSDLYSLAYEKIKHLLSKFKLEQIEILIAYFEFQAKVFHDEGSTNEDRFKTIDDMVLRLMLRRDELAKNEAT
jgi:hypothetical protein